jgi:hypothetical protein
MAEPTQPSPAPAATPAPSAPAAPEPQASPLEKVYTDFGVEAEAEKFQPQSPAPAQPAAPAPAFKAPDPFSPEFGVYQAQLQQGVSALHQSLQQTQQKLTALDQQLNRRQVEADIRQAAKTLSEKAGIDADVAEVAFEAQARKDPRLLQIWNNRAKNPRALEAALNALGTEFAQKYAVRQDPQLVENQRAVAASRQTMATTQKTSDADAWAEMSPQERQAKVQQLLRQGGR